MVINHNISALNTYNKLSTNETNAQNSLEKLSSGLRINKAADDAAGLAISQKMQAQINGLDQASSNAQNGISLIQTAEGGMSQIQTILQRMNDLANQSANGTNDSGTGAIDRSAMNDEFTALQTEINRIAGATQFNGSDILNTTASITLQIGANKGDTIDITMHDLSSASTSDLSTALSTSIQIDTQANAQTAIQTVQEAIDKVSTARSDLGTYQNRLNYTINNLSTESQNLQAASSQITDVDMAKEMTEYTKNNILTQAAEAMLAQANQLPQGVLSLLKS